MLRYKILIGLVLISGLVFSQKMTREEYIEKFKNIAIEKMYEYKIPASITLAQGILESGSGNSRLARKANNHFGIKCHSDWKGKTLREDDDARRECFRKYKSAEDSYRDHSLFLTTRGRYSDLFKLEITDYKGWAYGLKKAGYATNPKYPQLLIKIIEDYNLHVLDKGGKWISRKQDNSSPASAIDKFTYHPGVNDMTAVETTENNRQIYENNRRKFIIAKEGDDFYSLADEFNIYAWQIWKYNEMEKQDLIRPGQMLYLEKKRGRCDEEYYIAGEGESMRFISQKCGIRLKKLYKRNDMEPGTQPRPGQRLMLR